jgi:hypothetical protein
VPQALIRLARARRALRRSEKIDDELRLQALADVENKKREKAIAKHASEWL